MLVDRKGGAPVPLARSGCTIEKRFTFYDQVHTTGMDIKQALHAKAVVTLGKDMNLRDYSQGCWRMRGLGKGQRIHTLIVREVEELINDASANMNIGNDVNDINRRKDLIKMFAWLMVNSMRSVKMQHMQLQLQIVSNLWRQKAFRTLMSCDPVLHFSHEWFPESEGKHQIFDLFCSCLSFVCHMKKGTILETQKMTAQLLHLSYRDGSNGSNIYSKIKYSRITSGRQTILPVVSRKKKVCTLLNQNVESAVNHVEKTQLHENQNYQLAKHITVNLLSLKNDTLLKLSPEYLKQLVISLYHTSQPTSRLVDLFRESVDMNIMDSVPSGEPVSFKSSMRAKIIDLNNRFTTRNDGKESKECVQELFEAHSVVAQIKDSNLTNFNGDIVQEQEKEKDQEQKLKVVQVVRPVGDKEDSRRNVNWSPSKLLEPRSSACKNSLFEMSNPMDTVLESVSPIPMFYPMKHFCLSDTDSSYNYNDCLKYPDNMFMSECYAQQSTAMKNGHRLKNVNVLLRWRAPSPSENTGSHMKIDETATTSKEEIDTMNFDRHYFRNLIVIDGLPSVELNQAYNLELELLKCIQSLDPNPFALFGHKNKEQLRETELVKRIRIFVDGSNDDNDDNGHTNTHAFVLFDTPSQAKDCQQMNGIIENILGHDVYLIVYNVNELPPYILNNYFGRIPQFKEFMRDTSLEQANVQQMAFAAVGGIPAQDESTTPEQIATASQKAQNSIVLSQIASLEAEIAHLKAGLNEPSAVMVSTEASTEASILSAGPTEVIKTLVQIKLPPSSVPRPGNNVKIHVSGTEEIVNVIVPDNFTTDAMLEFQISKLKCTLKCMDTEGIDVLSSTSAVTVDSVSVLDVEETKGETKQQDTEKVVLPVIDHQRNSKKDGEPEEIFVLISLSEAQSIRRLLLHFPEFRHCVTLLTTNKVNLTAFAKCMYTTDSDGSSSNVNVPGLSSTSSKSSKSSTSLDRVCQIARFFNSEVRFTDDEIALVLESLEHENAEKRKLLFSSTAQRRLRDCTSYDNFSITHAFRYNTAEELRHLTQLIESGQTYFQQNRQITSMYDVFTEMDTAKSGYLNADQFHCALLKLCHSKRKNGTAVRKCDAVALIQHATNGNDDKFIDYSTFVAMFHTTTLNERNDEEILVRARQRYNQRAVFLITQQQSAKALNFVAAE
jgi:hypothetical protein